MTSQRLLASIFSCRESFRSILTLEIPQEWGVAFCWFSRRCWGPQWGTHGWCPGLSSCTLRRFPPVLLGLFLEVVTCQTLQLSPKASPVLERKYWQFPICIKRVRKIVRLKRVSTSLWRKCYKCYKIIKVNS